MPYTVVYDACVLYPAPLRDFLMHLALSGLFAAKWTEDIHDEWMRNLGKARPDIDPGKLQRTRELMDAAVPDSIVTGYQSLIPGLTLPDPDDRHVFAAAIVSGAQTIVTFNLKDFPKDILDKYGVEAVHPDEFVESQFELSVPAVIKVARQHRETLNNPAKTAEEYLETLSTVGLAISSDRLRDYIEVL